MAAVRFAIRLSLFFILFLCFLFLMISLVCVTPLPAAVFSFFIA